MEQKSILLDYKWQKAAWVFIAFYLLCLAAYSIATPMGISLNASNEPLQLFCKVLGIFMLKILPCLALLVICFSKEKHEDEYIAYLRSISVFSTVTILFLLNTLAFVGQDIFSNLLHNDRIYQEISGWANWFSTMPIFSSFYILIFKGMIYFNKFRCNYD